MSRLEGSKNKVSLPTSYETGTPAVNFYLAILSKAKQDANESLSAKMMWQAFQETELYQGVNKDPLQIAWWVCKYIG